MLLKIIDNVFARAHGIDEYRVGQWKRFIGTRENAWELLKKEKDYMYLCIREFNNTFFL